MTIRPFLDRPASRWRDRTGDGTPRRAAAMAAWRKELANRWLTADELEEIEYAMMKDGDVQISDRDYYLILDVVYREPTPRQKAEFERRYVEDELFFLWANPIRRCAALRARADRRRAG